MSDAHANFAYSLVATAPVPAVAGLSLVVTAGQGALFPATPFNCTVWPAGVLPISTNAEIIRVTAIAGDTFTIVRAQEGSTAVAIAAGYQIANTITVKCLDDIENSVSAFRATFSAGLSGQVLTKNTNADYDYSWQSVSVAGGGGSVTSANFVSLRSVVQANSAQMTSADNAISAAVNVVSNALSAEVVNRASADNVLSNRINSTNTVVSNHGSAIVANSAQMTSADNALSAAINVVSNAASNALSVANAVSNRLSTWTLDNLANVSAPAPTDQQALVFNSAQAQWVASTIAAGVGSVTSAELSAVSAAAASADATLSGRIDSTNTVVSNQGSAIAVNSAQMTSADNAISAAVNVVSNALSAEIIDRISADNVLSNRINSTNTVVSNQGSAIVANSAQMTSADNALSAAINVVSNAASNALSVANAVSNRLSTWTLDNLADVSAPAPTDQQVLVFNSAQTQWVASTLAPGTGSVTSAEVQAVSAAAASADATLSVRIDSVNTVVSNQGSAIVANSAQMTSADNAISAAAAAVSVRLDSTNTVVSNHGSAIVANSAQMTSADNAISAAAAAVSVRLNSTNTVVSNQGSAIVANSAQMTSADNAISNRLSTWTLDNLANVSAPTPADGQALIFNSGQAQWVASTPPGGAGSVTSAEVVDVASGLSVRIDSVANVVSGWATSGVAAALPIKRALAGNQDSFRDSTGKCQRICLHGQRWSGTSLNF
jgi:hypothetical protein